jgi:glucose-6-phosphate isomerase
MVDKTLITTLSDLAASLSTRPLNTLFEEAPGRMQRLSIQAPGLYADFSKQKVDEQTLDVLVDYAKACNLSGFFTAMANGEAVNPSEGRAAQHMALRAPKGAKTMVLGKSVTETVQNERNKMHALAHSIREGTMTGITGRAIRTLVHIGIGGSDLGPRMVMQALERRREQGIDLRFAANLDAVDINDALQGCDPESTLIVVVSKTFSTLETLANANVARAWLVQHLGDTAPAKHMIAISSNIPAVKAFGINPKNIFAMFDWVGGRYSLWSAVGLSLMVALDETAFDELLAGAAAMDRHALESPLAQNAPLLSGLIQFWNRNFMKREARAIVPYAARLALLPAYLQQLIMESNGKSVQADGKAATLAASPVVFGAQGTNAQHAFFQQLHQGPVPIPVDFIGFIKDQEHNAEQHLGLLANMLAQSRALMNGAPANKNEPHRDFPGDRPSTTLLLDELSPYCLGALLAFYEHETVTQAVLCGINAFDQWGVELGKQVATDLQERLAQANTEAMDPSTAALMKRIAKKR